MKVILIVSLAILTFTIGCTKDVPKCNDPNVIVTVKEIISEQKNQELKKLFNPVGLFFLATTLEGSEPLLNNAFGKKEKEDVELLKKMTKFVLESKDENSVNGLTDVSKYTVNSIITNKIEPDISKCNCSAKAEWHPFSDDSHFEGNISYDVQYTTDGEEYIVTLQDIDL